METLQTIWFGLIAVLWVGYFVLEGFDYGVGILLPVVGKQRGGAPHRRDRPSARCGTATRCGCSRPAVRRSQRSRSGTPPCSAASTCRCCSSSWPSSCAAWPSSTAASASDPVWRRRWDAAIVFGSLLPAVLWGVAFGNIVRGVELSSNPAGGFVVTGSFFDLLNPYALLGGLTTLTLFVTHGAVFLALKTDGDHPRTGQPHRRARRARRRRECGGVPAVVAAGLQQHVLDVGAGRAGGAGLGGRAGGQPDGPGGLGVPVQRAHPRPGCR